MTREELIAAGLLRPRVDALTDLLPREQPVLRLAPGERNRFEQRARGVFEQRRGDPIPTPTISKGP